MPRSRREAEAAGTHRASSLDSSNRRGSLYTAAMHHRRTGCAKRGTPPSVGLRSSMGLLLAAGVLVGATRSGQALQQPVNGAPVAARASLAEEGLTSTTDRAAPFAMWLQGIREEALVRGIRPETVREALEGIEPVARILRRDRAQATGTGDREAYIKRRLTPAMVRAARRQLATHRSVLEQIEDTYGVQRRFVVAIWGLESSFGQLGGRQPMIPTLATLAYDPRRTGFFRQELFAALEILDRGDIELAEMRGSWAGAMGQPQFMPSSYLTFAQDFDRDGRADIWATPADVFASIAYYLKSHEWSSDRTWGRPVRVPNARRAAIAEAAPPRDEGCRAMQEMSRPLPLSAWDELGVRRANGTRLPQVDVAASLVRTNPRTAYLVYPNYEALLQYNCAHGYALSVALLADYATG
ncbi:MAG: lytic murein transglycosylase [Luteitalea sp.]|nr:lytic murein transglycosylase [Luteitalea sp.]